MVLVLQRDCWNICYSMFSCSPFVYLDTHHIGRSPTFKNTNNASFQLQYSRVCHATQVNMLSTLMVFLWWLVRIEEARHWIIIVIKNSFWYGLQIVILSRSHHYDVHNRLGHWNFSQMLLQESNYPICCLFYSLNMVAPR